MSLRARLLAGMVVLVTVGLAVAAVATYAEQRSFLYNRLDQQVWAARYGVVAALLVAPCGLWVTFGIARHVRARNKRRDRICGSCGYDLRASPYRCPECGGFNFLTPEFTRRAR